MVKKSFIGKLVIQQQKNLHGRLFRQHYLSLLNYGLGRLGKGGKLQNITSKCMYLNIEAYGLTTITTITTILDPLNTITLKILKQWPK
jgi:hypothetical protein